MKCLHCGDTFEPERISAKFCSVRCRVAAHRAKARPTVSKKTENARPPVSKKTEADDFIRELRDSCTEKQKLRFDQKVKKAIEKAIEVERKKLNESYRMAVSDGIEKRFEELFPLERKRLREGQKRLEAQLNEYHIKSGYIKQVLSDDDYKLLLNCLHPDRAPEGRKEKYDKAFAAVKRLQPYINAYNSPYGPSKI